MMAGIKHSHMLFITLSIVLFQLRFFLVKLDKPIPKLLKIIPHVNDTLLLVTGISLAYIMVLNPMEHSWLMAKVIALFVYIGFGMMALKAKGMKSNIGYILACATFVFIVLTAIKKVPFLINI